MSRHRLLNVRTLLPIVTAMLLIIAVACGSSATATPRPQAVPSASGSIPPTSVPAPQVQATQAAPIAPSSDARYGSTVRMSAYADTRDWDPRGSSSLSSIQAVSQLYNQLVQMDTTDTGLIVCDLCESWEITNDGTTFTFKIRDGIQWIDGDPLTADDVVFSMKRYGDLSGPTGRSGLWRNYTLNVLTEFSARAVGIANRCPG